MRRLTLILSVIVLAVMSTGCSFSSDDQIPPSKVLQSLDAAFNAHDADAIVTLFADDAVVTIQPDYVYRGHEEIRDWLNVIQLQRLQVEARSAQYNGDTVTRIVRHSWNQSRSVEAFQNEVVIRQGKIVSYRLEIRPPQPRPTPTPAPDQPDVDP
jgi:hypothetical protein